MRLMRRAFLTRRWAKGLALTAALMGLLALVVVGSAVAGMLWLRAYYPRSAPLDLAPYVPRLQAFLAGRGVRVSVDKLELYDDNAPVLRAEGLRVLGPDGKLAVYGEAAAIKLAKGRLLQFALAPKIIEARNVTLRLVRTRQGVVSIAGFSVSGAAAAPASGLVEWLEALPHNRLWNRLKQVRAEGLTLLLRDDLQNAEWVLEDGRLALNHYAQSGEQGTLLAQVRRLTGAHLNVPSGVRGLPIPVLVQLTRPAEASQVTVEAKLGDLNAAVIGDYLPTPLQKVLSGRGTLAVGSTLTRGNVLGEPWLALRMQQAQLQLPIAAGYITPLKLPQLEATLSFAPSPTDTLTIRHLAFTGPRGNLFVISGTVAHVSTSPTLNLSGFSPGGDVQALVDFFPPANPGLYATSRWLRSNLRDVHYKNLVAKAGLRLGAFPGCGNQCGPLSIDADISQGQVRYLDELPPALITSASQLAHFAWRGQQFAVVAPLATTGGQQARSVWVNLNNIFSASPTLVQVSGTLAGPLGEVVEHLNRLPAVAGKIPGYYEGQHQTIFNLSIPLAHHASPTFAESTLLLQSVIRQPRIADLPLLGSNTLLAPTATLSLDASKTLAISAPSATVEGGQLSLQWQQNLQPGQPAAMKLALDGMLGGAWLQSTFGAQNLTATGGLQVSATVAETAPGSWGFQGTANAQNLTLGLPLANYRKAVGLPLRGWARGVYQLSPTILSLAALQVEGHQAQISGSLSLPLGAPETGTLTLPTLRLGNTVAALSLAGGKLQIRGEALDLSGLQAQPTLRPGARPLADTQLDAQVGTLQFQQGALRQAVVQAALRRGRWQLERVEGDVTEGGRVQISRQGNRLRVQVPNLGRTLEVFGLYDKLKGGTLFGTLIYRTPTLAVGDLKLNDFALKNPPTLMKILGLLSLEQLVAGTDSTKFNKAKLPVTLSDDSLALGNAHFTGPSMDLRLAGRYWREHGTLDFNGSLAPAIPFNRLVAKVPLLGTLLTGSQDGVVVADFRLSGPAANPEVSVRPLSILTPGLLKDLFRAGTPTDKPVHSQQKAPR
jgi:hypothetical protein